MKTLKNQFDAGKRRKANSAYIHYSNKINRLRRKYDTLKGKEASQETLQDIKRTIQQLKQQRRKLPSSDPFDAEYKRLYYCRYADDLRRRRHWLKSRCRSSQAANQEICRRNAQAHRFRGEISHPPQ